MHDAYKDVHPRLVAANVILVVALLITALFYQSLKLSHQQLERDLAAEKAKLAAMTQTLELPSVMKRP